VLFVFAIWLAYMARVRHLSHQLTMRMKERVNERTRIARDLHDTLLQGLISASLQLEVADRQFRQMRLRNRSYSAFRNCCDSDR